MKMHLFTACLAASTALGNAQTQIGTQVVSFGDGLPVEGLEVSTEITVAPFGDITNFFSITSVDTTDADGLVQTQLDAAQYDLAPIGVGFAYITSSFTDCDASEYSSMAYVMELYDGVTNPDTLFQEVYCDTAWYNGNCEFMLQVDTVAGSDLVNFMHFQVSDLPPDAFISLLQEGNGMLNIGGPEENGFNSSQVPVGDYVCVHVESDHCGNWVDCVGDIPCDSLYLNIDENHPVFDYQFTVVNLPQDGLFTWEITTADGTVLVGPYTNQFNPTASLPAWGVLGEETLYTEDVYELCLHVTSENCGYDWHPCIEFDGAGNILDHVHELPAQSLAPFPNPSNGIVHFVQPVREVSIFNMYGVLLETIQNASAVDLSKYAPSAFVFIVADGERYEVHKVMKTE